MNDLTDSVNISEFLDLKVPDYNDQNYEIETFKKIEYKDISDENEEIIKSKIIKDQELSRQYLKTSIEKMFELADCLQTDLKKFDTPNIEYVEALNNTLKNISLACTNFSKINQQSMMALQSGKESKKENQKSDSQDITNNVQNNILFTGNLQDLLKEIDSSNEKILNE